MWHEETFSPSISPGVSPGKLHESLILSLLLGLTTPSSALGPPYGMAEERCVCLRLEQPVGFKKFQDDY